MRELLALGYGFVTAIICVQAMLTNSFRAGAEPLAACVMNFAGAAIFLSVFLARHETKPSRMKLIAVGALAVVLVAAAFALMVYTRFRVFIYDLTIPGPVWLVVGLGAALLWAAERARARARG